jgi:small-conductance mechanosensitive channel/CRP-like cAMP-binding protein
MDSPFFSKLILAVSFTLTLFSLTFLYKNWLTLVGNEWLLAHQLQIYQLIQSLLFFSLAYLFNTAFKQVLLVRPDHKKIPILLQNLVVLLVYLFTIAAICGFVLSFSMTGFWTSTGALGVVFGFALKSVILDTFIGLALSIENEFKIGDFIILHDRAMQSKDNIIGQVIETNWRSTRLVMDGKQITIPNSVLGTKVVTNLSRPNVESEFEIVFTIDFSVSSEHVLQVLTAGAKSATIISGILEQPEPKVRVKGTNDLGVEYKVKYCIIPQQIGPGKARHFVLKNILEHLHYAGISLAYPKQDAYYARMPARHLDLNSMDDRLNILSRVYLFQTLQSQTLSHLASLMLLKHFTEGDILIRQNEEGDSMYILVEGLLYVYVEQELVEPLVKVGQITPGKFFGEMSLLTGEKRVATIKATTNAVVYEITRAHVNSILMTHPQIAEILSMAVAEYRMRLNDLKDLHNQEDESLETRNIATQILDKMKAFFNYHSPVVTTIKKQP